MPASRVFASRTIPINSLLTAARPASHSATMATSANTSISYKAGAEAEAQDSVESVRVVAIIGNPDPARICTSTVVRQNMKVRIHVRRGTELTDTSLQKFENHWAPKARSSSFERMDQLKMDRISADRRSENMRHIRSRNTAPELAVRAVLRQLRVRYRLHKRDLPGRPDIVMSSRKIVIFVHGCFWHQHPKCPRSFRPSSRTAYWRAKLNANVQRDAAVKSQLRALGWNVQVVWECETKKSSDLNLRVRQTIGISPARNLKSDAE